MPTSVLFTPDELAAYALHARGDGLGVRRLAARLGMSPGHASRVLKRATEKADELRRLFARAGVDPAAIDRLLAE